MSDAGKAVFLSYASQDAAAVERIAEALRAAGVEVWFDRNELVGGDAWDRKIRQQIRECALFVPVISAATQARGEGYFRLEWKLAVDRSHLMAPDQPFLLPVVIDDTPDAAARVADEFRAVQWTRLRPVGYGGQARPGGAADEAQVHDGALEAFCRRVKQLLGGSAVLQPAPGTEERGLKHRATPKSSRPWLVPVSLALAAVVALLMWWLWNKSPPVPEAQGGGSPRARPSVKTEADTAASLTARAFEHYYPFCTPGRLQLAEEFSRRATDLDPNYAPGWGARAGANARYLLRDWVSGEAARQRAREAQSFANRALSLDKNETEALLALGIVAWHQRAAGQAETLFRRVMTVDPANVQAPTLLSRVAREGGRAVEAVELMKGVVARAPRDPMVRLYAGFAYFDGWNFRKAAEQFEAASQVADFQGARVYKAWAEFFQGGDVPRMRAELDKLDLVYAEDDGKLAMNLVCALYERRADRVAETAGRSASTYLDDWWTPKAWFTALAFEFEHKENLARQQWQAAEAVVRERLKAEPQDEILRVNLAITLAKLGRAKEVRADFDTVEAAWREQMSPIRALRLARFHAAAGEAAKTVEWLRRCVNRPTFLDENVTPRTLALDPWWDGIRGSEEFRALLANPPAPPVPVDETEASKVGAALTSASEKSIAVLAFNNLSDDRNQEYFSRGLSEELSNALGRVPGLVVISTSAFSVKGQSLSVPEIARKLGVAYVVEGTVRPAGQSVRVTARLLNGTDGVQMWSSGNLNREVRDSLALQEELAGLIAQQLSLKLRAAPAGAVAAVNPEAYRLYLEGLQAWSRRSGIGGEDTEVLQAQTLFGRALALAPDFARAQAAFADTWVQLFDGRYRNFSPDAAELGARARQEVDRALVLGAELGEVQATHARLLLAERRYEESAAAFQRAIRVNPNYAYARQWYGRLLCNRGRLEEGLAEMKVATQLDPFSPIVTSNYALYLNIARRWPEVLAVSDRVLALAPDFGQTLGARAQALIGLARFEEARQVLHVEAGRRRSLSGDLRILVARLHAGERGELIQEAEARLAKPAELRLSDAVRLALALGRTEDAFRFARERPGDWRVDSALYFFFPGYDGVRDDPRFTQWLEDAGCRREYEQAWAEHLAWRRRTGSKQ